MEELRSIVDEVAKRLVKRGIFPIKGYKAQPSTGTYRRYGSLSDHRNWFVGNNEDYAVRFGESLLWVGSPSEDMRFREPLPVAEENSPRSYEFDKEVFFPLDAPIEAARGPIVQTLITQVEDIAELLRKPGHS